MTSRAVGIAARAGLDISPFFSDRFSSVYKVWNMSVCHGHMVCIISQCTTSVLGSAEVPHIAVRVLLHLFYCSGFCSYAARLPTSGDDVVTGLRCNTVLQRLKLTGKAALVTGELTWSSIILNPVILGQSLVSFVIKFVIELMAVTCDAWCN